jgi:excisionase family DNA binding protein
MVMMTVNEYAKRMASSASQIRQMCADGILPSVKIGKGYKIDVERADLYFARKIDERLNEARRRDDRKIIRTNKRKSESTFLASLDALKKKIGTRNVVTVEGV